MNTVGDGTLAVIPAGELWKDGSLRPAIEDLIGAGAIIPELTGSFSPETVVARDAFDSARTDLYNRLMGLVLGVVLCERGFPQDVEIATRNTAVHLYQSNRQHRHSYCLAPFFSTSNFGVLC